MVGRADRSSSSVLVFSSARGQWKPNPAWTQSLSGGVSPLEHGCQSNQAQPCPYKGLFCSCPGQHCSNKHADVLCAASIWNLRNNQPHHYFLKAFFPGLPAFCGSQLAMDKSWYIWQTLCRACCSALSKAAGPSSSLEHFPYREGIEIQL